MIMLLLSLSLVNCAATSKLTAKFDLNWVSTPLAPPSPPFAWSHVL